MVKQTKAITLISLIITIIVLLILAGVVINMTLGNDGIIGKAQGAVDMYKNAQEKEEIEIAKAAKEITTLAGDRANTKRNSENTMSGTEHFIGKYYIDGKPIYERTFYIASLPSNTTKTWYNHNIANVDKIWFDYSTSFIKWTTGETCSINYPDSVSNAGTNAVIIYDLNNTKFAIATGADRSSLCAYVTLQYTKTTDTATVTPNITTLTANT